MKHTARVCLKLVGRDFLNKTSMMLVSLKRPEMLQLVSELNINLRLIWSFLVVQINRLPWKC